MKKSELALFCVRCLWFTDKFVNETHGPTGMQVDYIRLMRRKKSELEDLYETAIKTSWGQKLIKDLRKETL